MSLPVEAAHAALKTASGESISNGVWTLVGVTVTTIGAIVLAYIKQWGPWKKDAADVRNADFARLRSDIADLRERSDKQDRQIAEANKAAEDANRHSVRADAKLQAALAACEILLGMVEQGMPHRTEIPIVKRLLAQAAADDMGIGSAMRDIARMPGTPV